MNLTPENWSILEKEKKEIKKTFTPYIGRRIKALNTKYKDAVKLCNRKLVASLKQNVREAENKALRNEKEINKEFEIGYRNISSTLNKYAEDEKSKLNKYLDNILVQTYESFNTIQKEQMESFEASQIKQKESFDAVQNEQKESFNTVQNEQKGSFNAAQYRQKKSFDEMMSAQKESFEADRIKQKESFISVYIEQKKSFEADQTKQKEYSEKVLNSHKEFFKAEQIKQKESFNKTFKQIYESFERAKNIQNDLLEVVVDTIKSPIENDIKVFTQDYSIKMSSLIRQMEDIMYNVKGTYTNYESSIDKAYDDYFIEFKYVMDGDITDGLCHEMGMPTNDDIRAYVNSVEFKSQPKEAPAPERYPFGLTKEGWREKRVEYYNALNLLLLNGQLDELKVKIHEMEDEWMAEPLNKGLGNPLMVKFGEYA